MKRRGQDFAISGMILGVRANLKISATWSILHGRRQAEGFSEMTAAYTVNTLRHQEVRADGSR
jgi:hypothetical protein